VQLNYSVLFDVKMATCKQSIIVSGNTSSIAPISLVKRFSIWPEM